MLLMAVLVYDEFFFIIFFLISFLFLILSLFLFLVLFYFFLILFSMIWFFVKATMAHHNTLLTAMQEIIFSSTAVFCACLMENIWHNSFSKQ